MTGTIEAIENTTAQTVTPAAASQGAPDPRPLIAQAQQWVATLLAEVTSEQWSDPTPCTDYDVADLIAHIVAVQYRIEAMGLGREATLEPMLVHFPADVIGERLAQAFTAVADRGAAAWTDAVLDTPLRAPMGTLPGRIVGGFYAMEIVTHGWDLAVATGQDPEADPALAHAALAIAQRGLPADNRADVPFGVVVPSSATDGPTEQLAHWLGRCR